MGGSFDIGQFTPSEQPAPATQNALNIDAYQSGSPPWRPDYSHIASSLLQMQVTYTDAPTDSSSEPALQRAGTGNFDPPTNSDTPWRATPVAVQASSDNAQTGSYAGQEPMVRTGTGNYDPPVNPNVPWRATQQVAPIFTNHMNQMGYDQQAQTQPKTGGNYDPAINPNTPWRATPQVAPAFPGAAGQGGTGADSSGQARSDDPNRNGNQPTGPIWKPKAQPGYDPNARAANGVNPNQAADDAKFAKIGKMVQSSLQHHTHVGVVANEGIAAGAGLLFGGPVPWVLNKTADSILSPTEVTRTQLFAKGSWQTKYIPKPVTDAVQGARNSFDDARTKWQAPETSTRYKAAKWWKDNFDPRARASKDLVTQDNQWGTINKQVGELVKKNSSDQFKLLKDAQIDPSKLNQPGAEEMLSKLTSEQAETLSKLQDRQNLLTSDNWLTVNEATQQLERVKNSALFTKEEMALLESRNTALQMRSTLRTQAASSEAPFLGESAYGNMIKGAAFVAGTMAFDNYLDKMVTGNNQEAGLNSNAIILPMALAALPTAKKPKDWLINAGIMAGSLVVGKLVDYGINKVIPESHQSPGMFSSIFHENGLDSGLLSAAFVLGQETDPKTRAVMVAGAWAAGRLYNVVHDASERDNKGISDKAWSLMQTDAERRSDSSMNKAIDEFVDLGKDKLAGEPALRFYYEDWIRKGRKYDDMMSAFRGAVILGTSFGESRLSHGTLVQGIPPNGPKTFMGLFNKPEGPGREYILQDSNLDFGGQALQALLVARVNVDRAKQMADISNGKVIKGSTVDANTEKNELDEIGQRIDDTVNNKIYGPHDMQAVMNELEHFYGVHEEQFVQIQTGLERSIDKNRNSPNKLFLAKLSRDLAVMDLAAADFKLKRADKTGAEAEFNGGDDGRQARGFDGAYQTILFAQSLDPNNPDIQKLLDLADPLAAAIPGAVKAQLSNPRYNPNNVGDQLSNPSQ